MNRSTRSLLSLALVAATATLAHAQPAAEADQAYQRGRSHYDLQEWDKAIAEFKEAYRLRPDAPSLFNIAQSYRLKGDCAQAASFYKTYRRNFPNEKNIDRVDQFIIDMDACTTTQASPTVTAPTDDTPTPITAPLPNPVAPVDEPEPRMPRGYLYGSITAAGIGVACVIGGAFAASRSGSIATEVEERPTFDPDLHARGERADLAAKLLFVGAGAALVTSGVLFFVGRNKTERHGAQTTTLQIVPGSSGVNVVLSGSL